MTVQYGGYGTTMGYAIHDPEPGAPMGFKLPFKRRLNLVAVILSLFLPCLIFAVVSTVLVYKIHYSHAVVCALIVLVCLLVVLAFALAAWTGWREKTHSMTHEPSWYIFVFLTAMLAWVLAVLIGSYIYGNYTEPFYASSALTAYGMGSSSSSMSDITEGDGTSSDFGSDGSGYGSGGSGYGSGGSGSVSGGSGSGGAGNRPSGGVGGVSAAGVDATVARGQTLMDAGIVYFLPGTYVDVSRATFYGNNPTYCVAPITVGGAPMANYDFWAVGLNCCNDLPPGAPAANVGVGYHCGDFDKPEARAGKRVMKDSLQPWFKLAVMKAQAAYNIDSPFPLFFHWLDDPINGKAKSSSGSDSRDNAYSGYGNGYSGSSNAAGNGLLGNGTTNGVSGTGANGAYSTGAYGSSRTGVGPPISSSSSGTGTWASRYSQGSDAGFVGLWPMFPSDFGLGSNGGLVTVYKNGGRVHCLGIFCHFLLQLILVALATMAFSKLGRT